VFAVFSYGVEHCFHICVRAVVQTACRLKDESAARCTGIDDLLALIANFLRGAKVHDLDAKAAGNTCCITQDPLSFCHIDGLKVIIDFSFRDFCQEMQTGVVFALCEDVRNFADINDLISYLPPFRGFTMIRRVDLGTKLRRSVFRLIHPLRYHVHYDLPELYRNKEDEL